MSTNTRAADLATVLQDAGYFVQRHYGTGGGCEAIYVTRRDADETHVLITDGDHREPWETTTWSDADASSLEAYAVLIARYAYNGDECAEECEIVTSDPDRVAYEITSRMLPNV